MRSRNSWTHFLEFVVAAGAEILRVALRPGDADGFRWPIGPAPFMLKSAPLCPTPEFPAPPFPEFPAASEERALSTARLWNPRPAATPALDAGDCCCCGSAGSVPHHFPRAIFGINDQVLSENSKSHEFNSHHIVAAPNAVNEISPALVTTVYFLPVSVFEAITVAPGNRVFPLRADPLQIVSGRCAVLCRGREAPAPKGASQGAARTESIRECPEETNFKSCSPRGSWVRRIVSERPLAHFLR